MNSAAKKILLTVGAVLLISAVGLAQTDATGSSSKTRKKHSTQASTTSTQGTSTQYSGSANASTPASSTNTSQSSALPQSDSTTASPAGSSSSATTSDSSAVKAGNSGFDDTSSSQNGSMSASAQTSQPSQNVASASSTESGLGQTASSPTGSQSTSSDEISNGPVAETVSDSNALIGWATRNRASNTGIKYGTNRASLSQTAQGMDGSDGKNHHAKLEGLSPNTRYYFQITENGQTVGGVGTFRTTAAGEQPVQSKAVIPQK